MFLFLFNGWIFFLNSQFNVLISMLSGAERLGVCVSKEERQRSVLGAVPTGWQSGNQRLMMASAIPSCSSSCILMMAVSVCDSCCQ